MGKAARQPPPSPDRLKRGRPACRWPGRDRAGQPSVVGGAVRRGRPRPGRRRARTGCMRLLMAQRDIACAAPDPDVVFRVLADAVLTVFPAEGAIASQPEGDFVVARAAAGVAGPPVGHRIPRAGTLAGRAAADPRGPACLDSQTDPRTQAGISASVRTRSSIIVPLVHDGAAVGLIAAVSSQPATFDETDLELLGLLADVATTRLVAALESRVARARVPRRRGRRVDGRGPGRDGRRRPGDLRQPQRAADARLLVGPGAPGATAGRDRLGLPLGGRPPAAGRTPCPPPSLSRTGVSRSVTTSSAAQPRRRSHLLAAGQLGAADRRRTRSSVSSAPSSTSPPVARRRRPAGSGTPGCGRPRR